MVFEALPDLAIDHIIGFITDNKDLAALACCNRTLGIHGVRELIIRKHNMVKNLFDGIRSVFSFVAPPDVTWHGLTLRVCMSKVGDTWVDASIYNIGPDLQGEVSIWHNKKYKSLGRALFSTWADMLKDPKSDASASLLAFLEKHVTRVCTANVTKHVIEVYQPGFYA